MNFKKYFSLLLLVISLIYTMGHCQMPCGIYDDQAVFNKNQQHIQTLKKGLSVLENVTALEESLQKLKNDYSNQGIAPLQKK